MNNVLCIAVLLLWAFLPLSAEKAHWPSVMQKEFVFHFVQQKNEAFSADIMSQKGEPLYQLDCAGANGFKHLRTAKDVWSGDLECHLVTIKQESPSYVSLLVSSSDSSPSAGRAVFSAFRLKGRCANYPEWGLVREFKLRGMRMVLRLSNVVFQRYEKENNFYGIKSGDLRIRVSSDPSARSNLAESSRYRPPVVLNPDEADLNKYRMSCTPVLRGK